MIIDLTVIFQITPLYPVAHGSAMLSNDDKTRYSKKLDIIFKDSDAIEPFELSDKNWKDDVSLWPPLEFEQIYSYLIDTPGEYTKETLKANKNLYVCVCTYN